MGAAPSRDELVALLGIIKDSLGGLLHDELGRVVCAAHGVKFGRTTTCMGDDGSLELNVFAARGRHVLGDYRHRMPDSSIDAAVALISETMGSDIGPIELSIAGSGLAGLMSSDPCGWHVQELAQTPPLALLAALVSALIERFGPEVARPK